MAVEIERKFLVDVQKLGKLEQGLVIKQGYIPTQNGVTVRVRIKGKAAFITLKGKTENISREEFEYPIPLDDAEAMLNLFCSVEKIVKTRYLVSFAGNDWEVDIFDGLNKGLVLAEIELTDENQVFELPEWVTEEVSADLRYYNVNLLKKPFSVW